jgi:hypothetical protein
MMHTLHFNSSQASNAHQDSMMTSLMHRLEVAKAAQNFQLVELLERERQQLIEQETVPQKIARVLGTWANTLGQNLSQALWGSAKLQVREFMQGSDHWWYAFDPRTGKYVYADSEIELRLWIKANYQGR